MSRKFVTLRVWHPDCWFLELTERHRDLAIASRGVTTDGERVDVDVVMHAKSEAALQSVLTGSSPRDVHREILHNGGASAELYAHYPVTRSIHGPTCDAGFLVVTPAVHVDGYEYWEVLTDDEGLRTGLPHLREHAEVRVERVSETPHRALRSARRREEILEEVECELSTRQFEILTHAVAHGYYDWPRGRPLKTLARDLGISGPTFLEHLRRAESRLVPSLVNELTRRRDPRA